MHLPRYTIELGAAATGSFYHRILRVPNLFSGGTEGRLSGCELIRGLNSIK